MDVNRISQVMDWLNAVSQNNSTVVPTSGHDITAIKNGLIRISEDISKEYPFFSNELFALKDKLFVGYGTINPWIFGQIFEILKILSNKSTTQNNNPWDLIHPRIIQVSRQLYLDGHYANAACDAFIEINNRAKQLYMQKYPEDTNCPDGASLMQKVLSEKDPVLKIADLSTETGRNIQNGTRFMLAGAMQSLRNPKAHENIKISADDAMRRLMVASLLMYRIDEAVQYSQIVE